MNNYTLDYETSVDPELQMNLALIDATVRGNYGMTSEHSAVGLLDLKEGRLAMIHPDRIEYAASVPKIGIMLAYFEQHPEAASELDAETRRDLGKMIKSSNNEIAAAFSGELGLKEIQGVLDSYQFYDESRGGGLWVGKHYGRGDERYGDPVGDNSHGATVRQLLRFYLLLEQGKLVSEKASETMREIFASPEIPHDDIKFVKALADRDVQLMRKWGSWKDWLHDTALITGPNRRYILVALTRHSSGDEYLVDLARAVDDMMAAHGDVAMALEEKPAPRKPTYSNPLLAGRQADPHVIHVDGAYYLYPTSHTKGYDAFMSDDLVNWEPKGPVFESATGGAWAPDVFHNVRGDGKFYLYYTDDHPARERSPVNKRIGVAVADDPLGPFADQGQLVADAIDAHMFQDDDGRYYLWYTNLAGGFKLMVQPMADPLTAEGEAVEILHPTEPWEMRGGPVTEAPFVLKRDGVYYLMYSGSPADTPDYAIGYARSNSPLGPFEKHPENPFVQRSDKVFGPGHHAVIEGPDGNLWMVYHQKRDEGRNYNRFIALDPLWFDEEGRIRASVSRDSDQPAPSGDTLPR